jgi:Flp pilus assembly protein TadG
MMRNRKNGKNRNILLAIGRDESGVAAVEFALVAAPFLAVVFAILQIGLIFIAGQALDSATSDAARMIRTGEAQDTSMGANEFRDMICSNASILPNCTGLLQIDVRRAATFADASMGGTLNDDDELDTSDFGFEIGGGNEIVVVRAFYEWPIWVPFLALPHGEALEYGDLASGNFLLTSALVFRNEPFS